MTEVGLATEVRDDPTQTAPGLSWPDQASGDWVISLNVKDHPSERAFVISHEVKHILDDGFGPMLYRPVDVMTMQERKEHAADYFAMCLLMPRPWVERYWRKGDQDIAKLARRFGASPGRMWLRLEALGLLENDERTDLG